jgi:hypothetical protein
MSPLFDDRFLFLLSSAGRVKTLAFRLPLLPKRAFPEGEPMSFLDPMHAGSLEALRVARPEAVAS